MLWYLSALLSKHEGQLGTEKITKSEDQRGLRPRGGSKHTGGRGLFVLLGGARQPGAELEIACKGVGSR